MAREVQEVELKLTRLAGWAGRRKVDGKQADRIRKVENIALVENRREVQEKRDLIYLQACLFNV